MVWYSLICRRLVRGGHGPLLICCTPYVFRSDRVVRDAKHLHRVPEGTFGGLGAGNAAPKKERKKERKNEKQNMLPQQYTNLWRLALPVIISQLGQMSVQLVDTMMVGHLGAIPLAGVSFANSLAFPVSIFGMGLAMGLTPLTGRASARGDFGRVQSLLKNSIVLNTLVGILLSLILVGLVESMGAFGQDVEILPTARSYGYLMVIGILPMLWFSTARQWLEGMGNTKWAMVITIAGNLINVGLNFVFIYGLLGMPEMGAVGAGLATVISRFAMVAMWGWLFWQRAGYRRYFVGMSQIKLAWFRMRRLLNVGGPISVQLGVEMAAMSLMAVAVGLFGAKYLAAHQIAINIPSMAFMVITGVANATTVLVSRSFGVRAYGDIRATVRAALVTITVFMVCTATLFLAFAGPIVGIFTGDLAVTAIAAHLLFYGALFQISDGIQGIYLGALRGLLEVNRPMFYAIGTYLLIGLPSGYLASVVFGLGAAGVWVGFIASLTMLCLLYGGWFRKKLRELELK